MKTPALRLLLGALLLTTAGCAGGDPLTCDEYHPDADGDGFGDASTNSTYLCDPGPGHSLNAGDCDDGQAGISPDAAETCDAVDEDCDGRADEGLDLPWYTDADTDGHGDPSQVTLGCAAPEGSVAAADDCDDTDASAFPGAAEVCDGDDDDCDRLPDEGVEPVWYADTDQDGHGDPTESLGACEPPAGYVGDATDCDDTDPLRSPDVPETCDGADQDCDGRADEGVLPTWYWDGDADGAGDDALPLAACEGPTGYVATAGDCDDSRAAIHPGAVEVCDDVDQDCDAVVDEGVQTTFYKDEDGDTHGDPTLPHAACAAPPGFVAVGDDCDDERPQVYPGAPEVCDGADQDCDTTADEGLALLRVFADDDGDGYGREEAVSWRCGPLDGESRARGDCDDDDPAAHPFAVEAAPDDGRDDDCGGQDGQAPCIGDPDGRCRVGLHDALEAASTGDTVWVGPGTYLATGVGFGGRGIALRSTHLAASTIIDGNGVGTVFLFDGAEGPDALLDGFTVTGGAGYTGGISMVEGASPTVVGCVIRGNTCTGRGGGMALYDSVAEIRDTEIRDNLCAPVNTYGGGLAAFGGAPTLRRVTVSGNGVVGGGGLYLNHTDAWVTDTVIEDNVAFWGGGITLDGGEPVFERCLIEGNEGSLGVAGAGGMLVLSTGPGHHMSEVSFRRNRGTTGGAVAATSWLGTLDHVVMLHNQGSPGGAGGVYLLGANAPVFTASILGWNSPVNVLDAVGADGDAPVLRHCDLYDPASTGGGHNLGDLGATNLTVNPGLVDTTDVGLGGIHLAPTSLLIDQGPEGSSDPDGSPADIGLFGGPDAGRFDLDGDGLPLWWWPGGPGDVPAGVDAGAFECEDRDPAARGCP